ncbi:MAG: MarR family transcriptional regulator [Solirubrobacteraceae bacterium]|nr:MarR family transcriptional regulator [Solirubrobacteraceae bacterium]
MRPDFDLPLLLLGAFRTLIDELHDELAKAGHPDARPAHGFALQAIGPEGASVSEVARRLGVSKQAAAKTVAGLVDLGYASRAPDPRDARASLVCRTDRGEDLLARSAASFTRQHDALTKRLGAQRVAALEDDLEAIAGDARMARLTDTAGWLA